MQRASSWRQHPMHQSSPTAVSTGAGSISPAMAPCGGARPALHCIWAKGKTEIMQGSEVNVQQPPVRGG